MERLRQSRSCCFIFGFLVQGTRGKKKLEKSYQVNTFEIISLQK